MYWNLHSMLRYACECDFALLTSQVESTSGENAYFWIEPQNIGEMMIEVKIQSAEAGDALRRMLRVEVRK